MDCLPDKKLSRNSRVKLLLAGVTVGLALLSKYHSAFIIAGVLLYMLIYNRKWFKAKETYIAFFIALILFTPVIIWNFQNHFVSFNFHESRVGSAGMRIRWDYFGTELAGQFFYNNPVNFILIGISLIAVIRKKQFLEKSFLRVLLLMSLPLAIVFIGFSLYSSTLPHWTGPAYLGLILVAAAWLSGTSEKVDSPKLFPWPLRIAVGFQLILILFAFLQINYGLVPLKRLGMDDPTTQLQGWRQLGEQFGEVNKKYVHLKIMPEDAPILTFRWFPAANLDYYVAAHIPKKVYSLGTLERIHKYYWIDKARGDLQKGSDAWYIAFSFEFKDPHDRYGLLYDSIIPCDTLKIYRAGNLSWEAYVFRLYGLKRKISFRNITAFFEPSNARIFYWGEQIRANPEWFERVNKKAKQTGQSLDDMMWNEASWAAELEQHK
jgi:hypothetical protein